MSSDASRLPDGSPPPPNPSEADQRAAELATVRAWIARNRDPDQFARMLWERTFVDPPAVLTVVATSATRWSEQLAMSVARSDELVRLLAERGHNVVPVLAAAYRVASSIGSAIVAALRTRRSDEVVTAIRHLNFLTLLLDHPGYGADQRLRAQSSQHGFLIVSSGSESVRESTDESPTAIAHDVPQLQAIVESGIVARRSAYPRLAASVYGSPLQEPVLRDAVRLLASHRLMPSSATMFVDLLIESGMRERSFHNGYASELERPRDCLLRTALRHQTRLARSLHVLPDHWLLLFSLLSRIGLESDYGLQVLGHCWRIEDETLLDDFEPRGLLVLPKHVWQSLAAHALVAADEHSLDLIAKLQARFPDRMPNDERAREVVGDYMGFGSENHRSAGLRILEQIAARQHERDSRSSASG